MRIGNDRSSQAPLVSVALCTYNGERFLRQQLDSLIAQDYPNLEIVALDDRSTDRTLPILQDYASNHHHLTVHQNRTNLGFARNFEKCLELCHGDFIALCDQDDVWFPHKISTLVQTIGSHPLVYSRVQIIDEQGNPLDIVFPKRRLLEGRCPLALLLTNFVTGHTALLRKELVLRAMPIPSGLPHDHWLAFIAASTNPGLKLVRQPLSSYRLHADNQILANGRRKRNKPKPLGLAVDIPEPLLTVEERRLTTLFKKLTQTPSILFNRPLSRFLKQHADRFLAAYHDPDRARRKLCMRRPRE